MGMNIGIITAEGYEYPPTRRLCEAAEKRGHRIIVVDPLKTWPVLKNGRLQMVNMPDIQRLDVVLPRQGATVNDSSLTIVPHLTLMGIPMVNNLDSIRLAKDQFLTLQALSAARLPVPDTGLVNSTDAFNAVLTQLGGFPVVLKQVSGRVGEGVFLIINEDKARLLLYNNLDPARGMLVQKFIPTDNRKDIRIFVIGDKIAGAMELKPKKGDFRANFHLTKKSWPADLTDEMKQIAIEAAHTMGLEIAGVDIIADKHGKIRIIEVNYSPGFSGLEAATGLDIAGEIIDYVVNTYGKKQA